MKKIKRPELRPSNASTIQNSIQFEKRANWKMQFHHCTALSEVWTTSSRTLSNRLRIKPMKCKNFSRPLPNQSGVAKQVKMSRINSYSSISCFWTKPSANCEISQLFRTMGYHMRVRHIERQGMSAPFKRLWRVRCGHRVSVKSLRKLSISS